MRPWPLIGSVRTDPSAVTIFAAEPLKSPLRTLAASTSTLPARGAPLATATTSVCCAPKSGTPISIASSRRDPT